MTIDTIYKEIEKRIEQLDEAYELEYANVISCKVRGDEKGMDKSIEKRRQIYLEKDKLSAMVHVYKRNW